jgi:hypothetical protein
MQYQLLHAQQERRLFALAGTTRENISAFQSMGFKKRIQNFEEEQYALRW